LAGSTAWRESRNLRIAAQFRAGRDGGERAADTVGAGSESFTCDGRKTNRGWERGVSGLRGKGQMTLGEAFGARVTKATKEERRDKDELKEGIKEQQETGEEKSETRQKQIFQGLCFYINGSTAPLISDHKLKHLLVERGAKMSIALGRRSVTHVILGTANERGGAGGGLAGGKIQKEIARVGGKGVKFVGVEWLVLSSMPTSRHIFYNDLADINIFRVVESIKADKRLPETRFAKLKLAPKGQNSVLNTFKPEFKTEERNTSDLGNG